MLLKHKKSSYLLLFLCFNFSPQYGQICISFQTFFLHFGHFLFLHAHKIKYRINNNQKIINGNTTYQFNHIYSSL